MKRFLALFFGCCLSLSASSDPVVNAYEDLAQAARQVALCREEALNPHHLSTSIEEPACGQLYAWGEFLLWRYHQDGLHFAVTGVETANRGKLYALDGDWESGFRVGVGYHFPCSYWDLSLSWLYFTMDDSQLATPSPGLTLWATRSLPSGPDDLLAASAQWHGRINSIALELAVPFYTRTCFALRPTVGVRGDWITQSFDIFYSGIGAPTTTFITNKTHMWGIGPEGGVRGDWYATNCFSFFGEGSFAYLFGRLQQHQVTNVVGSAAASNNVDNDFLDTTPVFNFKAGVEYSGWTINRFYIDLSLAWENMIWVDVARDFQYVDATLEGNLVQNDYNLTTSGVTFRARIGF